MLQKQMLKALDHPGSAEVPASWGQRYVPVQEKLQSWEIVGGQ